MNAIPRAGGNTFSGIGARQRLRARACRAATSPTGCRRAAWPGASTTLKKLYDINGAVGGPIKQDKLWFYATSRYFTNEFYLAGRFYPVDPTAIRRAERPRRSRRYGGTYTYDNNGRVTWAHQRQAEDLRLVRVSVQGRPALADQPLQPRRLRRSRITTWHTQLSTTKWTYTATNRLLFEAGIAPARAPTRSSLEPDRISGICHSGAGQPRALHRIVDQAAASYRAPTGFRLRRPAARPDVQRRSRAT